MCVSCVLFLKESGYRQGGRSTSFCSGFVGLFSASGVKSSVVFVRHGLMRDVAGGVCV